MAEHDTDAPTSRQSILETVSSDGPNADASTATDANHPEADHTDDQRRVNARTLPKEVVVWSPGTDRQLDYVFEVTGDLEKLEPDEDSGNARDDVVEIGDRVRVEGTVGKEDDRFAFSGKLVEVHVPSGVRLKVKKRNQKSKKKRKRGSSGWYAGYRKYAKEYVPKFYESVPSKQNLYRCVRYVGKKTNFWETLGKRMYLDRTVVTAAYFYPLPNYGTVEQTEWDGILGDMYADMPERYRGKKNPVSVPVAVVYLYDGYYNAVAYLRPYGNYESYGYAIENGYYRNASYDSVSDYESNTWWWTEDGWGDAGTTDGGLLDGVPIMLVD